MIEVKDEVLGGGAKYRIADSEGNIIQDNCTIEMVTPVIQEGTALNKDTLERMKFETVAPIFLSEGGDFGYYGVKAGATINKGDYVIAEEVQTNIGAPNQVYFKQESWETNEFNVSFSSTNDKVENLKMLINGETYFVVGFIGSNTTGTTCTLKLYKYQNGKIVLKHTLYNQGSGKVYNIRLQKMDSTKNNIFAVLAERSGTTREILTYEVQVEEYEEIRKMTSANVYVVNEHQSLGGVSKVADNCFLATYGYYSSTTNIYIKNDFFFWLSNEETGALGTQNVRKDDVYFPNYITRLQDGTVVAIWSGGGTRIMQIDTTNYTTTYGSELPYGINGISLFENMRNLDPQNDEYYVAIKEDTKIYLEKWIIKPSENIYTMLGTFKLPETSGTNKPWHIIGQIGNNLIISESGNNISYEYNVWYQSAKQSTPLHLIMIKKDLGGLLVPKINTDLTYEIYTQDNSKFWNGNVCWTVMIAENSATIWAYYGYISSPTTTYYHEISLKPYERQIRPIANVNEKIFGIANAQVGTYDTPARAIEMIVEKKYNTT